MNYRPGLILLTLFLAACESYVLPHSTVEIRLAEDADVGETIGRIETVITNQGYAWNSTRHFEEQYEDRIRRGLDRNYYDHPPPDVESMVVLSIESPEQKRGILFRSNGALSHGGFSSPRITVTYHQRREEGFDESAQEAYMRLFDALDQISGIHVSPCTRC